MYLDDKPQGSPSRENCSPTITKLSEAIRAGAKLRPQSRGEPFHNGRSCAWGAAAEALGMPYREGVWTSHAARHVGATLFGRTGWAWERLIGKECVCDEVWRRNDDGMPREAIADWLEAQGY